MESGSRACDTDNDLLATLSNSFPAESSNSDNKSSTTFNMVNPGSTRMNSTPSNENRISGSLSFQKNAGSHHPSSVQDNKNRKTNKRDSPRQKYSWKKIFRSIPLLDSDFDDKDIAEFYNYHVHGMWNVHSKGLLTFLATIAIPGVMLFFGFRLFWVHLAMQRVESNKTVDGFGTAVARDSDLSHLYVAIKSCVLDGLTEISLLCLALAIFLSRNHNIDHMAWSKHQIPSANSNKFCFGLSSSTCPHQRPRFAVVLLWCIFLFLSATAHFGAFVDVKLVKEGEDVHAQYVISILSREIARHPCSITGYHQQTLWSANELSYLSMVPIYTASTTDSVETFTVQQAIAMELKSARLSAHPNTKALMADHEPQYIRAACFFAFVILLTPATVPSWRCVIVFSLTALFIWTICAFFQQSTVQDIGPENVSSIVFSFLAFFLFASFQSASGIVTSVFLYIEAENSKNSMKKDLFRWSFHEVRVPCSAILGGVELLVDDTEGMSTGQQDTVFDIAIAARQLKVVLDNVLEWQRSSELGMSLAFETFEVSEWLADTTSMFSAVASRQGISLQIEQPFCMDVLQDSKFRIKADVQKLTHVILNMLSNALKFANSRVTCRILVASLESSNSSAEISLGDAPETGNIAALPHFGLSAFSSMLKQQRNALASSDLSKHSERWLLLFQILDDGPGMENGMMQLYHSEFHAAVPGKASVRTHGTGLGAHIANKMILAHGGRMFIRSTKGLGTVLTVGIPVQSFYEGEYSLSAAALCRHDIRDCFLSGADFFKHSEPIDPSDGIFASGNSQSGNNFGMSTSAPTIFGDTKGACTDLGNADNELIWRQLTRTNKKRRADSLVSKSRARVLAQAAISADKINGELDVVDAKILRKQKSKSIVQGELLRMIHSQGQAVTPPAFAEIPGAVGPSSQTSYQHSLPPITAGTSSPRLTHKSSQIKELQLGEGGGNNSNSSPEQAFSMPIGPSNQNSIEQLALDRRRSSALNSLSCGKSGENSEMLINFLQDARVLLVEDEKMVARVCERLLSKRGAIVSAVINGVDCIREVASAYGIHSDVAEYFIAYRHEAVEHLLGAMNEQSESRSAVIYFPNLSTPVEIRRASLDGSQKGIPSSGNPLSSQEGYSVILLDMLMPKMNGLETVEILNAWRTAGMFGEHVPYMLGVTGNSIEDDLRKFEQMGADFAFPKPLDVSLLQNVLRMLHDQKILDADWNSRTDIQARISSQLATKL